MNQLSIRLYTDPVLHKTCPPVELFDQDLKKLVANMLTQMAFNNGVGLAANQIGVSKRLCVAFLSGDNKILINPEIVNKSTETNVLTEGCLSAPGIKVPVKRFNKVIVRYLGLENIGDTEFKPMQAELEGMDARIIQHEIDHLFGKTIFSNLMM